LQISKLFSANTFVSKAVILLMFPRERDVDSRVYQGVEKIISPGTDLGQTWDRWQQSGFLGETKIPPVDATVARK